MNHQHFPGNFLTHPAYFATKGFWCFIDWLYPPNCAGCGKSGSRWCEECHNQTILFERMSLCHICNRPIHHTGICHFCINHQPDYDIFRSWGVYQGPLRNAMHRLKYEGDIALGDTFAIFLIQMYNEYRWPVDIVVPVPLSKKRFNERGYNQSAFIALSVSLGIKKPISFKALYRIKETNPQFDLSPEERWQNVQGAFKTNKNMIHGKNVLLIDDISTTGATINACAKSMKDAGALSVHALTVSYAL